MDTDRFTNHTRTIFDENFRKMPFEIVYPNPSYTPQKPKNFELMKVISSALGVGFGGLRVDLYNLNGCVIVGELTFTHGGGSEKFKPREWDGKLGTLWGKCAI